MKVSSTTHFRFSMALLFSLGILHVCIFFFARFVGLLFLFNGIRLESFFRGILLIHLGSILVIIGIILLRQNRRVFFMTTAFAWALCFMLVLWCFVFFFQYKKHSPSIASSSLRANPDIYGRDSILIGDTQIALEFFISNSSIDEEWIRSEFLPALSNNSSLTFNVRFSKKGDFSEYSRWGMYAQHDASTKDDASWLVVNHGSIGVLKGKEEMECILQEGSVYHDIFFPINPNKENP